MQTKFQNNYGGKRPARQTNGQKNFIGQIRNNHRCIYRYLLRGTRVARFLNKVPRLDNDGVEIYRLLELVDYDENRDITNDKILLMTITGESLETTLLSLTLALIIMQKFFYFSCEATKETGFYYALSKNA
ncbi:hypothetical protein DFQ30_007411 [Apophysomyces sp. BC1015]|nr:hypothetical protein DFQ30_007411 [Apophysomyces sp. BC1015]KAG0176196.1 hypothetical protein DFQ29_006417 [Apophysomyces sp. BC1021]